MTKSQFVLVWKDVVSFVFTCTHVDNSKFRTWQVHQTSVVGGNQNDSLCMLK